MKKLLLLLIPLFGAIIYSSTGFLLFTAGKDGAYTVYGEKGFPSEEYTLTAAEAAKICLTERERGISVRLYNADYKKIAENLSAEEIFTETVDGIILHYYRSPFMRKYVTVNGRKINLEIAEYPDGKRIVAGSPMIMGSI